MVSRWRWNSLAFLKGCVLDWNDSTWQEIRCTRFWSNRTDLAETCTEESRRRFRVQNSEKLLSLPTRTAVLVVNRKTYLDDGRPFELTRSIYRGDRYSSIVHSSRNKKSILKAPSS